MEAGALPRAGSGTPAQTPRLLRLAPDARLVGLVREGRGGAFEALYDRHHKGILSFCRHMLGDADEAEDAVQHTFMAAYRELADSDEPIHLRAWLYTVARNRCYSIIRARREQPSETIDGAATEGLATEVQRRQDLRDLVADLRRLPDEQRAALVLAELDALSHEDIAGVLGVPRDKVKALVYQARESLVAERTARDTACSEIREQLASGRGAVLRRSNLRRHLRECDGCREFRAQVETQRKQFAVLLPVLPAAALKEGLFGGAGLLIGGTAAVGGGAVAATALKTGVVKGVLGAVLASVGTAGTLVFTGSGMQVKSLVPGIERAVPTFIPTIGTIDPPPRAKPIRVTSTRPAVVRSFGPIRVVRPATAIRSPAAAEQSAQHTAALVAAPVRVPHSQRPSGQRPSGATPVAAAIRVPTPAQPTAPATQVPSPKPVTPSAAPTVIPSAPAATPPTSTIPAPTASPVTSTPPAASPTAPATPVPASPPAEVPQPVAAVPSTPAVAQSQGQDSQGSGSQGSGSQGSGSQSAQSHVVQSSPSSGVTASAHSVSASGSDGNGDGNAWGHDQSDSADSHDVTSTSTTTTPVSTTTTPVFTTTTPASTVPSITVPGASATTTTPATDPGSHGNSGYGDSQSGYSADGANAGEPGSNGNGHGWGQGGAAADGSANPGADSPYSH